MRGNTVNLTDPSGRFVFLAALAAIAIVAAVGTILGGIGGFAVDIYNQLNNNGGNWNCLDVGQAAQRGLNNALFGGGVGLTVGVAGVGAYSLLSPWLIPAAGTLGAQDPKKVEAAIEFGHDVADWVGETLAAQDSSVSHALIDSSANPIQDALPITDPGLQEVVDAIDNAYPGLIEDVNFLRRNALGELVEIDIETTNAIIEVKSGTGQGFTRQVLARMTEDLNPMGKPVITYGPDMRWSVMQSVNKAGGIATRDLDLLIEILRPD